MKTLMILAAAMSLGAASFAQDATTTNTQTAPDTSDTSMSDDMQTDPAMSQPTQTDSAQPMTAPMSGSQPMSTDSNMSTQGSMSAPMSSGNMSNAGMMQPQAASGDYPRCSRTVTDRCTQIAMPTRRRR